MTYSSYELKYCERCGGLGLRREKSGLPYCFDCEQMMQHFLLRPAETRTEPGQLRRIVHRLPRQVLDEVSAAIGAQEVLHAS
jgi:hypothetical protein